MPAYVQMLSMPSIYTTKPNLIYSKTIHKSTVLHTQLSPL